jgi:hypothetical protein
MYGIRQWTIGPQEPAKPKTLCNILYQILVVFLLWWRFTEGESELVSLINGEYWSSVTRKKETQGKNRK